MEIIRRLVADAAGGPLLANVRHTLYTGSAGTTEGVGCTLSLYGPDGAVRATTSTSQAQRRHMAGTTEDSRLATAACAVGRLGRSLLPHLRTDGDVIRLVVERQFRTPDGPAGEPTVDAAAIERAAAAVRAPALPAALLRLLAAATLGDEPGYARTEWAACEGGAMVDLVVYRGSKTSNGWVKAPIPAEAGAAEVARLLARWWRANPDFCAGASKIQLDVTPKEPLSAHRRMAEQAIIESAVAQIP